MLKNKYRLNLQLFSSDDFFGGNAPDMENPILADDSPVESVEAQSDTKISDATKNSNTKPVAITDHNHTQQPPQLMTDFSEISSKLDMLMNRIGTPDSERVEVEEMAKELTEEDIEKMNNDFYLQFTEKPLEAIEKLIEERAESKIAPVMEYFTNMQKAEYWTNQIKEFSAKHPDFDEYIEDVSAVIQNNNSIRNSENPLELAYKIAKSDKLDRKSVV